MSWVRTLLGLVALVTLAMLAHPPSGFALIEVRSGPGMSYAVVARMPAGASYVAVAQEQEWYKIQLPDGRAGWIHTAHAVQEPPPARTPPVVAIPPAMPSPTAPPTTSAMPAEAPPPAVTPSRPAAMRPGPPLVRRTALVIGNAAYAVSPLQNAGKDATEIAALLQRVGFDVTLLRDVSLQAMDEAVQAFHLRLHAGGVGLFYFAGHGVQVDGENYLIPVNARMLLRRDVRYLALPLGRVIGAMEEADNGLNIVILDACRNLPFARSERSSQGGLAPPPPARGMLIAYATAPGGLAADGAGGEHGVYTKHLLHAMTIPGLSLEQVFKQVRSRVIAETAGQQIPWEASSLLGEFAFVPAPADRVPPGGPAAPADPEPGPLPQLPPDRAASATIVSDHTPHEEAGRIQPLGQPAPPPSAEGYTLIRRIYCEDTESGAIQGSMDLRFTSYLSCEEAKNALLVWEQQKDYCRYPKPDQHFADPTRRESQQKAHEWIGTPSCHRPS